MKYVNLTPKWTEILPTWIMLLEQAILGDCTDPGLVRANARKEFTRMAEGADMYNALCAGLRDQADYDNDAIGRLVAHGQRLLEVERHTVKDTDND